MGPHLKEHVHAAGIAFLWLQKRKLYGRAGLIQKALIARANPSMVQKIKGAVVPERWSVREDKDDAIKLERPGAEAAHLQVAAKGLAW